MTPSITETQINKALGEFLQSVLPAGTPVIVGQVNRVAEPPGDFVVMWPLRLPRLSTNVDAMADAKFIGAIAGPVMTITEVEYGKLGAGKIVFGTGIADGTKIIQQITGTPGGLGTYSVLPSQSVSSTTIAAGTTDIEQSAEVVIQIDVHGPNSQDNTVVISTLFRDGYAVDQMEGTGVTPLYAEDPRQMPFTTGAAQYEDRWTIDVHLQIKPVISVPQQYADQLTIQTVSVEATYPAT